MNSDLVIVNTLEEQLWREYVNQHPHGNIFHTPEMFRVFECALGHHPSLLAAIDKDGHVLGLLLPVQVTLMNGMLRRLTTRSIAYGGLLCTTDVLMGKKAVAKLLQVISASAGRESLFTQIRNLSDTSVFQTVLSQCGFTFEDHLNFLIDLNGSTEEVLQNIGARTRKHIRRALRRGTVIIEQMNHLDQLAIWYKLVSKSYLAAHVPLADQSLFEAAFNILQPRRMVQFWLARIDSSYVAASAELLYKDIIYGWYSGVDRAFAAEHPGEMLMWQVLSWGAQNGYKTYDFGGAGKPGEAYGVRDFKAKFGGKLVCFGRNTCIHAPLFLIISMLGYRVWTGSHRLGGRFLSPRCDADHVIQRNASVLKPGGLDDG